MEQKLTQNEIDERVAILHRLRNLLEEQRTKFKQYLTVLEMQETKILTEDADSIIAHSELEAQVVKGIGSLQKVIAPMQKLYQSTKAATYNPNEAIPVSTIEHELEELQQKVLIQNKKNQELLRSHITDIKKQINDYRNPYKNIKSVYSDKVSTGNLIMIDA